MDEPPDPPRPLTPPAPDPDAPPPLELEDDAEDVAAEVASHLTASRQHLLKLKLRKGHEKTKMELLSESLYSSRHAEEVGDEFFQPEATSRRGIRLKIGQVQGRARAAGNTIKRIRRRHDTGKDPQMVVVEEEDPDIEPRSTNTAPVYGFPALNESPVGSVESLDSSTGLSRTTSVTQSEASRPPTPSPAEGLLRFPGLTVLSQQSSATSTTTDITKSQAELRRPPSRTLTIDDSQPRPRRRDSRSDFTPRRNLTHLRPKDLSKVLASRRRKLGHGAASLGDVDAELEQALAEAVPLEEEEERTELDVLYEHQRGLVVFGLPKFASAALTQVDPAPWTNMKFENCPFTRHDHPLPTPFWHWIDREWMVDMSDDVDEQGWSYATRFGSRHWRGQPDVWRSFVRRRRWVRARIYIPKPLSDPSNENEKASLPIDWAALHNSEFAERCTPSSADVAEWNNEIGGAIGLKRATALLPLSDARKDDVFSWSQAIDAKQPFLAWSFVKYEGDRVLAQRRQHDPAGSRSEEELFGIWRDAVIEINYRKVARVLKDTRLDREKLGLWRWWLGLPVEPMADEGGDLCTQEEEISRESSLRAPNGQPSRAVDAKSWSSDDPRPTLDDVWDLVEGRLDPILQLFEFQLSRINLLQLILSLHPIAHTHHHYHSFDRGQPFEPGSLSPAAVGSRLEARLEFYTDIKALLAHYTGAMGDELEKAGMIKPPEQVRKARRGKQVSRK